MQKNMHQPWWKFKETKTNTNNGDEVQIWPTCEGQRDAE